MAFTVIATPSLSPEEEFQFNLNTPGVYRVLTVAVSGIAYRRYPYMDVAVVSTNSQLGVPGSFFEAFQTFQQFYRESEIKEFAVRQPARVRFTCRETPLGVPIEFRILREGPL